MKIAVFHPGTQHSWQTATALQNLERLQFYATSIFYNSDKWPYRVERFLPSGLRAKVHREFSRFEHRALNPDLVKTIGFYEWLERMAARGGFARAAVKLDQFGNRRFASLLASEIRSADPFALWGYNSSALESFQEARAAGRVSILDRTIGDWRYFNAAMAQVFESHADWFPDRHMAMEQLVIDRDDAEYAAADHIVCGSDYCAKTIRDHSPVPGVADKLRVIPYCFDEALFAAAPPPAPVDRNGPVRFLFVGQIGMRKGVHHVLEAIAQLPRSQAELTLVGHMQIARDVFARYADRVTYIPTVARHEIPGIMARHHAMVFPSYFEGSSLSLLESLASGMAVIHPPQAGNGVTPDTGILLKKPDTQLTLEAMLALIHDRDRLDHYRAHAQTEARNYTFARYRENIARFLADVGLD
ncbi:glycosyltransferase family 4 protein [Novosphingobium sp. Leaf2]|uniref:glycosyltransferase family 4 protein n=1 Tax=Novosphingobium sp. Leaf2 TaxID=1735670 RepID=UPI0006F69182|nr:glycosyltransferase family 4 protein [Novosphingobium sp. Leaf2]KQM14713.1 hypothetical protein ASE49_11095 [Novosphingobium sp. Leaf2]